MRRVLAGLAIGLGVLLVLVSVVDDTTGGGFGWEPVLQFTAGGLNVPAPVGPWHSLALTHRSSRSHHPARLGLRDRLAQGGPRDGRRQTTLVGERAGRADARPRLTCSLATVSQGFAMRFSDAVKRHRANGGDLGQCDALRCSCGNEPHLNGFHTFTSDRRRPLGRGRSSGRAAGRAYAVLRLRRGVLSIVWVRRGGRDRAAGLTGTFP